jgi:glutamate synthase domain-containing protein 2
MDLLTRNKIVTFFTTLTISFGASAWYFSNIFLALVTGLFIFCLVLVIIDINQTKHAILRNYPLIGRLRWFFESERSKIQQYFIEDDKNGTPYNREKRSDVYQKAKGDVNTTPFGTQLDVYAKGYEFIKHSMYPKDIKAVQEPRVTIGSKDCIKPYSASILNISAMSYGALSNAAVLALNGGAKLGDFYHNTGEGGVTPYHLENGGDLCYQIGTGYFGCGITLDGKRFFDDRRFLDVVKNPSVKMIEIKLSQGAKPGHGGILPASKNTTEIAKIRGIEANVDVISPPFHSAFSSPTEMLGFIKKVRKLSGGLPVGIKMCVGKKTDVIELFHFMYETQVYPDFITIDGGEGGTGAAPLVFTNNVGTPLLDALKFVNEQLIGYGLRDDIKIIASGKVSTSFDIIKMLSLGADTVNAARSFMLSLGCIQARECNKNTCPVGIATQNPKLVSALNPAEKKVRVYNYHKAVVHEVKELLGAMGLTSIEDLTPECISYRDENGNVKNY